MLLYRPLIVILVAVCTAGCSATERRESTALPTLPNEFKYVMPTGRMAQSHFVMRKNDPALIALRNTQMATYQDADRLLRNNQAPDAIVLLERLLQKQKALLGDADPQLIRTYRRLRQAYSTGRDCGNAERYGRMTADLADTCFGKTAPDAVLQQTELARVLDSCGRKAEAEEILEQRVDLLRAPDSNATARVLVLYELALLYERDHHYKKALELLNEAAAVKEDSLAGHNIQPKSSWIQRKLTSIRTGLAADGHARAGK